MLSSSEGRRRKKDPDRERSSPRSKDKDREKDREKDPERHKRSKSSKTSRKSSLSASKEGDRDRDRLNELSSKERIKTPSSHASRSSNRMAVVPEMERRASLGSPTASRTSLPYPTFSKTYSKENIYSREEGAERRKSLFTPEPTDLGDESLDKEKESGSHDNVPSPSRAPPSPPLTATTAADLRKTASANSMRRKNSEALEKEMEGGRRSVDSGTKITSEPRFTASRSSVREDDTRVEGTDLTSTTTSSRPSTVRQSDKSPHLAPPQTRLGSPSNARPPGRATSASRTTTREASEVTQSTDSDATSIAPDRQNLRRQPAASPTNSETSPASVVDSSPRTPTQHSVLPSVLSTQKDRPPTVEILTDPVSRTQSIDPSYSDSPLTPPPPPPPPALGDPPRVDYLLQNGGLPRPVPRSLFAVIDNRPIMSYSTYQSPQVAGAQFQDVNQFFAPFRKLLDDYATVLNNNGSLAVATGYKSIARRLLDRLENVFARNIASEHCTCIMCVHEAEFSDEAGINWGEILELVSGRCDLPVWPPFDKTTTDTLGIPDLEAPCQRIDDDVPEEYREHYAHQSRKTKVTVQSWLSNQQEAAPEDADDETLEFAMCTRLPSDKRPLFYALLYGMKTLPSRNFQPQHVVERGTPPSIAKAAIALERLYRLANRPRDHVVVMYLLRNPNMHNILATLSAVTKQEWEILISGRFDGFLWSGAENIPNLSSPPPVSRNPSGATPSRIVSPFSQGPFTPFSPGPSPAPYPASRPGSTRLLAGPAPVQMDEETEIAVLAEVEREIYLGMEALEDSFEHLHNCAEVLRRQLRERCSSLSIQAQARRGPMSGGIQVRTDTPASYRPDLDGDALEDLRSDIGPDDSASNVSHNRRRRGHRAKARHTPAPVEEESEEDVGLVQRVRKMKF
ncbi:uncharacterized protein BDR25DRAFT_254681 [Lindgomyces ingoldianus]|uniref:Uncharacterized protein n=1 Tax=Lindgomyces ingoldianus TaxID=673940 RepID=A0ACB6R601_9PLEO|nr:uncharacterized protein BDR25DRAFT_254681 [Lindgomyces ingoldianus]KAF2474497.1 hypothetical protein BDR25DRAFT_254681 [Lindgomyces ingoldianus]